MQITIMMITTTIHRVWLLERTKDNAISKQFKTDVTQPSVTMDNLMKTTNTEHIAEIAIILAKWLEYIAIDNRYKMHLDVLLKSVIVSQETTKLV